MELNKKEPVPQARRGGKENWEAMKGYIYYPPHGFAGDQVGKYNLFYSQC